MGESLRLRASTPPYRSERSPGRRRSSHRGGSPPREKHSGRAKSPRPRKSPSPAPLSPSPRTKRLRRAQSERDAERRSEREHDRNHSKRSREGNDDRDKKRDTGAEKRGRRSERDETNGKSSRPRGERSESPPADRHRRSRHPSRSPVPLDSDARARQEATNTRTSEQMDDLSDSVAKMEAAEKALEENKKQKPTFELSGKLAAETNRVRGVTLLFTEPPDARKPDIRWRSYVFKGGEVLNETWDTPSHHCFD